MKIYYLFSLIFILSFVYAQDLNEAQSALDNSLNIIKELDAQGFNIDYANDSYSSALLVFQQAKYADILRNSSISESDSSKVAAKSALKLVNWKNITYSNVIYYTDLISKYKVDTYELYDSIASLSKRAEEYSATGINVSVSTYLIVSANESFYKGQFKDSFSYVEQARAQLEKDFEQVSSLSLITENAKGFLYRYMYWIIFFVVLLAVIGYFSADYISVSFLKRKIARMEIEERVLNSLIEKTQKERYKENSLSELVYNIRVKKYQARLSEIKQDLPVLKKRLSKR